MKAFASKVGAPEITASFQEIECADNICMDEVAGASDGAVNMRFGGQMHDMGDLVPLDDFHQAGLVADVCILENVFGMRSDRNKVFKVASVGETIKIDQFSNFRPGDNGVNDIRTNKAGAA